MNFRIKAMLVNTGLWILGILAMLVLAFYILVSSMTGSCPDFDEAYLELIPYKLGNTVTFTTGSEQKTYTVTKAEVQHKEKYKTNVKCGTCGDNINFELVSATDTITITTDTFSVMDAKLHGLYIAMGKDRFAYDQLVDPKATRLQADKKRLTITRHKGISSFYTAGKQWELQSQDAKKSEEVTIAAHCGC